MRYSFSIDRYLVVGRDSHLKADSRKQYHKEEWDILLSLAGTDRQLVEETRNSKTNKTEVFFSHRQAPEGIGERDRKHYHKKEWDMRYSFIIVWFLCFNGISTTLGYLMPNPFSEKNSSSTIQPIAGRIRGFIPFARVFTRKWT